MSETESSPSSQPAASAGTTTTSLGQGQAGVGSTQPLTSPASTGQSTSTQTTSAPATQSSKPGWLPDSYWAEGKISDSFGAEYAALATRAAADDVRRNTLPKSPAEYKAVLPADFKTPDGQTYVIDDKGPLVEQLRALVFDVDQGKTGGQEAMSRGLALLAGNAMAEHQRFQGMLQAEEAKLGASYPARKEATERFWNAYLGPDDGKKFNAWVNNAVGLPILEKIVNKIRGEGGGAFTATGREPPQTPGRLSEDQYGKMSADDKMAYARQFNQTQMPAWRDPRH